MNFVAILIVLTVFALPCFFTDIICTFEVIEWTKFGLLQTCSLRKYIRDDKLLHGDRNENVKAFKWFVLVTYAIPDGFATVFPNLIILQIVKTGLKKLFRSDLSGFKNLRHLNCNENRISSLKQDTFGDLINLEDIYMQGNRIEHLLAGLFENNLKLEVVDFSRNRLVFISFSIFFNLIHLKSVQLLENKCIDISTGNSSDIANKMLKVEEHIMKLCNDECLQTMIGMGNELSQKNDKINSLIAQNSLKEREIETCEAKFDATKKNQTIFDHIIFRLFFGNWN